jgi:hypothetical protein
MSNTHEQITKSDLENPDNDKKVLTIITGACDDWVVKKEAIQQVVNGKQTESVAVDLITSDFNSYLHNEDTLCEVVINEYKAKLPNQEDEARRIKADKRKLEDSNTHKEGGAERFTGSSETRKKIELLNQAGTVLFFIGYASTVIVSKFIAENSWTESLIVPLTGVLAAIAITKVCLLGLQHSRNQNTREKVYPIVKYILLPLAFSCIMLWLYFYADFIGERLGTPPDPGNLDGDTSHSAHTAIFFGISKHSVMIFLGALGESLTGGLLMSISHEMKEKYTVFDGLRDTQIYAEIKERLANAESSVGFSNGRISHCENLRKIIKAKMASVKSQTSSIYHELFQNSIR